MLEGPRLPCACSGPAAGPHTGLPFVEAVEASVFRAGGAPGYTPPNLFPGSSDCEGVASDESAPRDAALARALGALASPVRIALLRQLQTPRVLREIEVKATDGDASARNISRQAVREHLDRLMETGVVVARETEREYGTTLEYSLNHQALFALSEEFRALARLRPAAEPHMVTVTGGRPAAAAPPEGPSLVLVKGVDEGRTFDLRPPAAGRREWVIGRRRGLDISLDFDPFISTENSAIVWEDGVHAVVDLPESRNGTMVNFKPLPKGARHPLRVGDLIGVGRSLLMFRA